MAMSPRKFSGGLTVEPAPGTPKNHAPGSFSTKGEPWGIEPSMMAVTAMNPRMAGRTSRRVPSPSTAPGSRSGPTQPR